MIKLGAVAVTTILLSFGLIYLIGAFIAASFNISDWSSNGRFFIGLIGGFISVFTGVAVTVEAGLRK